MSVTHVYLSTNWYEQTATDENDVLKTGATVTLTLYNGLTVTSPQVTGVAWPVTLSDIGAGVYRYEAPFGLAVVPGRTYLAVSDAELAGRRAHNEVKVICQKDSS